MQTINSGSLVRSQFDFYFPIGSFTRLTGLGFSDFQIKLFHNNSTLSWSLLNGSTVSDSSISSGSVFINEIAGSSGYYNVRFYPDKIGFWRLVLRNPANSIESIQEFNVVGANQSSQGLIANFNK